MFILKIMSQKVDQSVDNDYQHKKIRMMVCEKEGAKTSN
jgi:hypothetical protein